MINKVPGEYNDKFEGLKAFYGYMFGHPGKKLTFMGNEFAQFIEWNYKQELDWFLLDYPRHKAFQKFMKDLNHYYLENKALWQLDCSMEGFKWIVVDDNSQNIVSFLRRAADGEYVTAGSIIYRQRGTKIHPGKNVGRGTDDTLFAYVDGYVKYEKIGKDRKQASVYAEK